MNFSPGEKFILITFLLHKADKLKMKSLLIAFIRNISQIVICSDIKHARNVFAFTEQGGAMPSSVLHSQQAVQVNTTNCNTTMA